MKTASLILIFFSLVGSAAEIVWLTLTPKMTYQDIEKVCNNFNELGVNLGVEFRNEKAIGAVLDTAPGSGWSDRLPLNANELSELRFFEEQGSKFLESIRLSPRMLNFLLSKVASLDFSACAKPTMDSIAQDHPFVFARARLGMEPFVYHSSTGKLWGYREDGWGWNLKMRLTQTQYKKTENLK